MRDKSKALAAIVVLVALLFVLPGIAGVAVGGISAQAGWWLIAVGVIFGLAAIAIRSRRPA